MRKNENFSMADAQRLASSEAGQQLYRLLQQEESDTLETAMAQAAKGDYSGVQKTLSALLSSPQAKELLKQMGGDGNG